MNAFLFIAAAMLLLALVFGVLFGVLGAVYRYGLIDYLTLALAIVGSRNPTRGGIDNAREFSRHMAARGLGITSGMASGIDAAAHEGALAANGITIAVVATGLDRVYPASNRELAHRIADSGLLVSEFPPGQSQGRDISRVATGSSRDFRSGCWSPRQQRKAAP